MTKVNIGIIGTGFIAKILAPEVQPSSKARLAAVSSRTLAKAEDFVASYPGAVAVEGADRLIARDDVDAVYISTPTSAKEDVASRALAAGCSYHGSGEPGIVTNARRFSREIPGDLFGNPVSGGRS